MSGIFQIRKGLSGNQPNPLFAGEFGWDTDTNQLYIGTGTINENLFVAGAAIVADFTIYVATSALGGGAADANGLTKSSGTTTATTANKLVDAAASFDSTYLNKSVYNKTDDTWAKITAVDSASTLSLSVDIMTVGETYDTTNAFDSIPLGFASIPTSFQANITERISPGTFTDTITYIGKTAGANKILTIQGSTTGTTAVDGETTCSQKLFFKDLTITKRFFELFGHDGDWATCVFSGDDGFIINKANGSKTDTFRASSVVTFENDPGAYTNIGSTVNIGYTQYVAGSTLGGDNSNDGYLITQGSATSTSANKLIDFTASFNSSDHLNKTVYNSTDDAWAKITAIDSTTQVTLDTNIMVSGENYKIVAAKETIQDSWNSVSGQYNCNTNIRMSNGIFREAVDVFGKTASGPFEIPFVGTRLNTHTGTATSGANLAGNGSAGYGTLTHTGAGWTVDTHQDNFVEIISGTGSGQIRNIMSNTSTVALITGRWDIVPDNTSVYRFYTLDTRITGADSGAETTPVRDYCLKTDSGQKGIVYNHLWVDYAGSGGDHGVVMISGGSQATFQNSLMEGAGFWGVRAVGASAGAIDTVVFKDTFIGDVRVETGASISRVKRVRSTGSTNRCINPSTTGSIFDIYETYLDATSAANGILCDNGGIAVTDGYLEVNNAISHNISVTQNSNCFFNAQRGAFATTVVKDAGGWGVFCEEGGIGVSTSNITFLGNVSGTFTPVTALAGGNS